MARLMVSGGLLNVTTSFFHGLVGHRHARELDARGEVSGPPSRRDPMWLETVPEETLARGNLKLRSAA